MMSAANHPKVTDFKLGDAALVQVIKEQEARLKFPSFNPAIAFQLGEALRKRFSLIASSPDQQLYIQIRPASYRQANPMIYYAAVATGSDTESGEIGPGLAFQLDGKANTVLSNGASSLGAKAFASMMGWEVSKMGLSWPEYNTNGGGFPIKVKNCSVAVGIILVSGQPDLLDHQFIIDTLDEFLPTLQ